MPIIEIEHLTKDYGHNRGVFDVSFSVEQGPYRAQNVRTGI